ncbi:MAG: hypothetical protein HFH94_14495 [Lachnospiraceae bacterium]|jgi:hypothetical protein|nr:hypothetical protein [uncultured Acetatifactor sp.]MCI9220924.1 hypothetical protein [Lachnospiraceae bacterium]
MRNDEILEKLRQADMVLAGLGEEFDGGSFLRRDEKYVSGCEGLKSAGCHWLMPAWSEFCLEKQGRTDLDSALEKLSDILQGKNHFVVSVSTDSKAGTVGRAVMACGSSRQKQCIAGCKETLLPVSEQDKAELALFFEALYAGEMPKEAPALQGGCPVCGGALILNNVYAENYNEEGYLEQWRLYMKWLQGTLNHKLFVLELGVGMRFPSVIRWPFEKAAFFNREAYFCRIHEKLYQLTKELSEKGCGISKKAIDWLAEL